MSRWLITLNTLLVREYGLDEWGKLFNVRQLLTLTTFARLVGDAHAQMRQPGIEAEYSKAVSTMLGLAVTRTANRLATICPWDAGYEKIVSALSLQALPMKWDYAESTPLGSTSGSFREALEGIAQVIEANSFESIPSSVLQRNIANTLAWRRRCNSPLTRPTMTRSTTLTSPISSMCG